MRLPLALCTLLALGAAASPALAAPPGGPGGDKNDPKYAARALAEQGHAYFEAGQYAQAVETLQRAEKLYHAPTIVMALARAHAGWGKLVEAREHYQRVIDEKLAATAPPAFREAQRQARVELAALERRIPAIQVAVQGSAGRSLRVSVDDVEIADYAPARFIPVNPGLRRLSVLPAGGPGVTRTVEVSEGARMVVQIELRGVAPAPVEPRPQASGPRPWLLPSVMSFGLAAVGLGVGVGTGVVTMKSASDLRARCGDVCPRTAQNESDVAAANGMGIASTVGFVLAGAGLVTGVVLVVVKPGGRPATVQVGPGSIGFHGVF